MDTSLKITSRYTLLLAVTGASGAVYARSLLKKASGLPGTDIYVIFTETAKQVWETETGEPWPGAPEKKDVYSELPLPSETGTGPDKDGCRENNRNPEKDFCQKNHNNPEKDFCQKNHNNPEKNIRTNNIFFSEKNTCTKKNIFLERNNYRDYRDKNRIHFIANTDFTFPYASGSNRLDSMIVLPCSMGTLGRIAAGISADLIGRIADVQLKEKRPLLLVPREAPYNLIHLRNMTALCEAGALIIPASPSFYHRPDSLETLIDSFADRLLEIAGLNPMDKQFRWNP